MSTEAPPVTSGDDPNPTEGPGASFVGGFGVAVLVVLGVAMILGVIYALGAFWPDEQPPLAGDETATELARRQAAAEAFTFLGFRGEDLNYDARIGLLSALGGSLGAMIHGLRSLGGYAGNRNLVRSWLAFYAMLPFVGGAAALVFYLVLRAGLFSPSTASAQVSPFGFAAIGALIGLFSEQAMVKLREIFQAALATPPPAKDPLPAAGRPVAVTSDPLGANATSATLTGIVTPGGLATTWFFEHGPTTAYGAKTAPTTVDGSADATVVHAELTGLAADTVTHYRLVATNEAGRSEGSDRQLRTTV